MPRHCITAEARQKSIKTRRAMARDARDHARRVALEEAARLGVELGALNARSSGSGRRLCKAADLRSARLNLWRAMRGRGLPFTAIAAVTGAGSHATVITALQRGGGA